MRSFFTTFTALLLSFTLCAPLFAAPQGRYKQIVDRMTALQQQYADYSKIISIGTNDDNEEVLAIRISGNPNQMDPTKIGQVIVSTHHGNESGAPQFTMAFIENLLKRYTSEEFWVGKLADQEWTIVPVLNISGYNNNQRQEHNVDPNRDYPGPCHTYQTGKLKSIQRVMELLKSRIFAGSVTVHGYDGSFSYPWGMYVNNYKTLDDNIYESLFAKAAEVNDYKSGNGAILIYPANGCYEDYIYWKYGSWSLLLELESGDANDIKKTVPAIAHYFSLLDSSPSQKNTFNTTCTGYRGPDLRVE